MNADLSTETTAVRCAEWAHPELCVVFIIHIISLSLYILLINHSKSFTLIYFTLHSVNTSETEKTFHHIYETNELFRTASNYNWH